MEFDSILKKIGQFGRYQRYLLVLLLPTNIIMCMHNMAMVFLAYTPEHTCRPPSQLSQNLANISEDILWNLTVPMVSGPNGKWTRNQCERYEYNWTALDIHLSVPGSIPEWSGAGGTDINKTDNPWGVVRHKVPCTEWEYDTSVFVESIVTKVCVDWLPNIISMYIIL